MHEPMGLPLSVTTCCTSRTNAWRSYRPPLPFLRTGICWAGMDDAVSCERPDERVDIPPLLVDDHLALCLHDVDAPCCAE